MHVGKAWKYPRAMAPFGAIEDNSEQATEELFSLMEPEEVVYVPSEMPLRLPGLHCEGPVDVLQFTYPQERALPRIVEGRGAVIERLSCADAQAMAGLTDVAFPGFFRRRTCEMGRYYGIRDSRQLVAMCGERMNVGRYREISGLCTHPEARGQGYATLLMARLLQDHQEADERSYLHVASENTNAIALYERMGFECEGAYSLFRVTREQ